MNAYTAERLGRAPQDHVENGWEEMLPDDLAALRLQHIRRVLSGNENLHVEEEGIIGVEALMR